MAKAASLPGATSPRAIGLAAPNRSGAIGRRGIGHADQNRNGRTADRNPSGLARASRAAVRAAAIDPKAIGLAVPNRSGAIGRRGIGRAEQNRNGRTADRNPSGLARRSRAAAKAAETNLKAIVRAARGRPPSPESHQGRATVRVRGSPVTARRGRTAAAGVEGQAALDRPPSGEGGRPAWKDKPRGDRPPAPAPSRRSRSDVPRTGEAGRAVTGVPAARTGTRAIASKAGRREARASGDGARRDRLTRRRRKKKDEE